jgi:Phage gp6-like head-tail connector protein
MSYVSLAFAKEHCNVTADVSDTLLQVYINSAEGRVAAFLNRPLSDLLDDLAPPNPGDADPNAADTIRHAICLYVDDAVQNRGTIIIGTISSELRTAENMLYPYRVGLGV